MNASRALLLAFPLSLWHLASPTAALCQSGSPAKASARPHELTLARLRPGKDSIATADRIYGRELRFSLPDASGQPEWYDACTGHFLRVEVDENGAIESVTVSSLGPRRHDCSANPPDLLNRKYWKTGRGLALNDPHKRVLALYGEPDSSGPSTQQGRELELLFYSYEELGTEVPQILEITLERGRVVQITLAFPGL